MTILIDTHIHIYPIYSLVDALNYCVNNMNRIDPQATRVMCLAERHDCDVYQQLLTDPGVLLDKDYQVEPMADDRQIRVSFNGESLYILPGRQLITAENIEVLALACTSRITEGQTAASTIEACRKVGGVPVLAWSPGKWFFKRGRVVADLLQSTPPNQLLIGDTSLRPLGWGQPRLIRYARRSGMTVVAGSDPLPFAGEERLFGAYVTQIEVPLGVEQLHELPQRIAAGKAGSVRNIGRRSTPARLGIRLINNKRSKRA